MTRRRVVWLAVAALLALGALLLQDAVQKRNNAGIANPVLWPAFARQLNDISVVTLRRGDGSVVTLERGPNDWRVRERGYVADTGKLRKLLLDLAELSIVEEKTADAARYAVLGVEEANTPAATSTLLELRRDPNEAQPSFALIVGKTANGREMYVRRAGEARSYLVRPNLTLETTAARWLDTRLVDIKADRVQRFTAKVSGSVAYVAQRAKVSDAGLKVSSAAPLSGKSQTAKPQAFEMGADQVAALLGNWVGLTFDDVRARGTAPAATTGERDQIELTTFDGLNLKLEGQREGERRWVRVTAQAAAPTSPPASPPAASQAAVQTEAKQIQAKAASVEYELPSWKYDAIFKKWAEILPVTPSS
jgi:hypothetical protein